MKKIIYLIAFSSIIASCSSRSVDLAIDNPTEASIIVKVDTLSIEIPPHDVVWVEMGKGNHTVTLENDSVIDYDFQQSRYMLNPSRSEYILLEELYGTSAFNSDKLPNKKITFLGVELEGNMDVVRDVINPINWDCGPREAVPEMVEAEEGDLYVSLLKLYDANEFIEYAQFDEVMNSPEPVRAGE